MRPGESFIGQPVRSLQTMLRVIASDDPRIPIVIPDGIYGPSTMNAVTAFQRLYDIPITGITDQNTWEQITIAYEAALVRIDKAMPIEILLEPGQIIEFGESNPYIYILQGMLTYLSKKNKNIPTPSITGTLDSDTADAIIAFQRISELNETGNLDRLTWLYVVKHYTLEVHKSNDL